MKKLFVVKQYSASVELALSKIPESFESPDGGYEYNFEARLLDASMTRSYASTPEFTFVFEIRNK